MEKYNLTQTGAEVQEILNSATPQSELAAEVERAQGAEQTLQGNIDAEELRAKAAERDLEQADTVLQGNIDAEELRAKAAEKQNADDIDVIEEKIPTEASSSNQLADKAFVNSSIASNTATYRGSFNQVNDLHLTLEATEADIATALASAIDDADNNDYCYLQVPVSESAPTEIAQVDRYKFNGATWAYEYTLNNSGFTADQWAALNSAITSGLVDKLSALPNMTELTALLAGKQNLLNFDTAPTTGSNNPVTSGGVKTAIDDEKTRAQAAEQANNLLITQINGKIPSDATSENKLVDKAYVDAADATMQSAIEGILALIPEAATALNQLADKAFVNSSIATNTGTFKGTYNVVLDLELFYDATQAQIALMLASKISSAKNNDYCYVQVPNSNEAPTSINHTDRYKYNGTAWAYEYTLNNSGFTAGQWSAINSGITELLKNKLVDLPTATELTALLAAKQNQLTFDTTPTTDSTNPVTSGGVKAALDTEVERAQGAEQTLQDNIDAEELRAKAAEADRYTKAETYSKNEIDGLVSTPHQEYVTVATYASLPVSGSTDTIYRVSSYDGANSQVDDTVYSEYAWNGTQYVFLCVKSQIEEVFDITVYNNNTKYANLAAALGVDGANIPATLRRGGMSVKYVQSSDNKYVQYRLMSDEWSTTVSDWQGVDDVPTAESENLVKSGGVYNKVFGGVYNKVFGAEYVDSDLTYGYVYNTSGEKVNNRYVGHFPVVYVKEGDVITYRSANANGYLQLVAFDSQQNVVLASSVAGGSGTKTTKTYTVPSGIAYIQVFNTDDSYTNSTLIAIGLKQKIQKDIFELSQDTETAIEVLDTKVFGANYSNEDLSYDGYGYNASGEKVGNIHIGHFPLISVEEGELITYRTQTANGFLQLVAFNANKEVVLNASIAGTNNVVSNNYVTPNGVAFIEVLNTSNAYTGSFLKKDGLQQEVDVLKKEVEDLNGVNYTEADITYGYGYTTEGVEQNNQYIGYTPLVLVEEGDTVLYNSKTNASYLQIVAFDVNKNVVLSKSISGTGNIKNGSYEVESGVAYIQLFNTDNSYTGSYIIKNGLKQEIEKELELALSKTIRTTHVICGFEEFGLTKPHHHLEQATLSEDVKQLVSQSKFHLARSKYMLTFKASSLCFIGIGTDFIRHLFEFRVNGDQATIRVDRDWVGGQSVIVSTETMPFTITAGNVYTISIERVDNTPIYNNIVNGVIVRCTDGTNEYSKIIDRNYTTKYNGIWAEAIAGNPSGNLYVSLKEGAVDIIDIAVSSAYDPAVKVALTGDSFAEGNTLVAGNHLDDRYCTKIQNIIGKTAMLIDYLPGGAIEANWYARCMNNAKWFMPDFFILAMGTNNADFSSYKLYLESLAEQLVKIGIKPVLVTVTPVPGRSEFQTLANAWVRNSPYRYVDVCAAVTDGNDQTWKEGYVMGDQVHPTVAGHQAIFEAFCKEIPELFE